MIPGWSWQLVIEVSSLAVSSPVLLHKVRRFMPDIKYLRVCDESMKLIPSWFAVR